MKTVYRESIVTIAVILVFVVWGCSHTKKDTSETAAVPEEVVETVEVDEEEVVEVPVEVISNLSNIYFDFDKSVLSREAIEELKEIGAWLLENPNTKIRIEGNCDDIGAININDMFVVGAVDDIFMAGGGKWAGTIKNSFLASTAGNLTTNFNYNNWDDTNAVDINWNPVKIVNSFVGEI